MRRKQWIFTIISFLLVMVILQHVKSINTYISSLHQGKSFVLDNTKNAFEYDVKTTPNGKLLTTIKKEASKKYIAPIDAKVDPIWKAIPGYNGLEVDVTKTWMLSKNLKSTQSIPFVYKEIPPNITLDKLGAQPIYRGNPNKPMVALMINVAWGNEYIPRMLTILKKENVHATFFFDGSWLKKNTALAMKIKALGNECANHAYSHKNMSQLTTAQATAEIMKTQRLLKNNLGVNNDLFAPPSGDFDQATVNISKDLGLKTILWTIDTVDWKRPSPSWILERVAARLHPGALILMHPTSSSSAALEGIIHEVKRRGLQLGTVSEVISSKRVNPVESPINF